MLKIREGNKFTWAWAIVRGSENVDLGTATNIKFSYQFRDKAGRVNITEFTLAGNIITTNFLFNGVQGIVNLRLIYELPVIGLCTVDVDAFEIVASSEEASEGGEFSMTSDMAIGFTGKNAYEVWLETHTGTLEDYEAFIKGEKGDNGVYVGTEEPANPEKDVWIDPAGTYDIDFSNYVVKETGKSLISDAEIARLKNVTNQTLSDIGGEASTNKQNNLTNDGTGTKFPTVDAVNAAIGDIETLLKLL